MTHDLYFLDCEASSLDSGSYPIEIAWVDSDGRGESYLIQPHWSWHGWSVASAAIHNITRDMLRDGSPAADVARRAQSVLLHAVVISDDPAFDQYWLEMLLKIIDAPPIKLYDMHGLIGEEIKRAKTHDRILPDQAQIVAMTAYEEAKHNHRSIHRALPDAEHNRQCWKAVRTAVDGLIKGR